MFLFQRFYGPSYVAELLLDAVERSCDYLSMVLRGRPDTDNKTAPSTPEITEPARIPILTQS